MSTYSNSNGVLLTSDTVIANSKDTSTVDVVLEPASIHQPPEIEEPPNKRSKRGHDSSTPCLRCRILKKKVRVHPLDCIGILLTVSSATPSHSVLIARLKALNTRVIIGRYWVAFVALFERPQVVFVQVRDKNIL